MPHKLRKTRKMRGSRTYGWGKVGQHRGAGCRGHRKVGRHKHLWSYVTAHEPNYFGKHGFTSHQSVNLKENVLNISMLDELSEKLSVEKEKGKVYINLTNLGFTKLLGTGKLTKKLSVNVPSCSKSAADKIKRAGGEILLHSQEQGE